MGRPCAAVCEMRHAPFYNLFGLIPYDPTLLPVVGQFLHLGVCQIIMGITMFAQIKLNPSPPDPTQKMIFDEAPSPPLLISYTARR